MVGSEAIRRGVKQGVDEALEAKAQTHDDAIEAIHTRLAALETWHPVPRP